MSNIVCFGEVLWDVFPSHKKIGGAPLNVALRLNTFNNNVTIISSVGKDENGANLLNYLKEEGLDGSNIQIIEALNTSEVIVSIDSKGSASYSIEFPCAWDFITYNDDLIDTVEKADAFIFGSLIARNEVSYKTLLELLNVATYKVFDVNLRPPHYKISAIKSLMQKADFIKFNDDELFEICNALQFNSKDLKENILFISEQTNTKSICVTLGEDGAVIFINNTFCFNDGYKVNVKDTVGSGDSFLATLIDRLLKNETPQQALDYACAIGALVASSEGANPKLSNAKIKELITG